MDWFVRDFDHPAYFTIYADKAADAAVEGPALAALLNLPSGSRILDLPCGWGRLNPHLRARGLQVIGGDLSPLNLAKHRASHPVPLVRLDFRALPFRQECTDGVFCAFTSWGYFATEAENLRQLTEFARVIRKGGVLLLDLAGRSFLQAALADVESEWLEFSEEGYQERAGWDPEGRRILTERLCQGESFCHDIWIPTDAEVRHCLDEAGFTLAQAYGGLDGRPWEEGAERWIYRAVKQ
ncbi:MAG: methyltransferase domain-containing protein [Geothrix sp.]|uniref:class I SAM-dependent methyltransferase n=1 Tax=Geothrix sp. TaxID=1962974 RepID=UPI0017C43BC7|nr:class I SAM-dependent methyltransferase [Geothrix sp.]NWJ40310.1 methyltransferase domain-containing protein [Geothrix sp.]WIL21685.1 MAG: methyltransferase domain-containing protein [Geothrix sp.]